MKYYHITPIKNKVSIIANGLRSNENQIFLYTELVITKFIAANQLGISEYSIFEISKKGVSGNIRKDNVADFGSVFQYIIEQDQIEPKYLKHLEDVSENILDMINQTEEIKFRMLGYSEERIINLMRLFPDRVKAYNKKHATSYTSINCAQFNLDNSHI
jgi:L-rhamnose mutarotase